MAEGDVDKEAIDVPALFPELSRLRDPELKRQVVEIWQELWAMSSYQKLTDVPVSVKIDYPQVRHCRGVLTGALALADAWEPVHDVRLDRDVLIAGALLIDVSKLVETHRGPDGTAGYTELGRRLPHATYAAHLALAKGVRLDVVHCILSHSPSGGKAPQTPEAQLLDWLDQADISGFGFDIWSRKVVHYQP
ncbi:MAG: HD domain-containing protein [Micromonosporaceae bacterium]|nr:HD domain-containing protein [Micromonosporaceae bacterium]